MTLGQLRKEIEHDCELGEQVVDQARRRVLEGEQVPTAQKIYSIFEPHTDLIKRGKVQTPIEFGHKIFLAESAQGLITQYKVLDGNPCDEDQVAASLAHHRERFGHAPQLYGSDRGFYSENNVKMWRARRGQGNIHPTTRGEENTPARSLREEFRVQEGTALPCRYRGAHLRSVPRSRHEALSGRGSRAL